MIPQLTRRLLSAPTGSGPTLPITNAGEAAAAVLSADPFDLVLYLEQVWDSANVWAPNGKPAGPARTALYKTGNFAAYEPVAGPAWDHFLASYVLENTRMVQIFGRVVREFRSGEGLGVPSVATQWWLDTTETMLLGAWNILPAWLSTSAARPDPESVRRNAYWRMFGMDLSFGADDNRPKVYQKALASNTGFVKLFEELLYEIWQAMINLRNVAGVNSADNDRIYAIAQELQYILRSRRQKAVLAREELASATALGWLNLTIDSNTPVVVDLKAQATSAGDRLRLIGERVGLPAHSKSTSLITMAEDLSILMRTIEADIVTGPESAWVLYDTVAPGGSSLTPLGSFTRRIITEWSSAAGRDLKARKAPIEVQRRPAALVR
ncbi:hypothetical protein [Leifsonia sp. NPDC058248]|uniref:hypothetical protein n=1 Tax=Leifsonia sp. NPDC058248 TaxID=3346402 RepID=UPI0036DDDE52